MLRDDIVVNTDTVGMSWKEFYENLIAIKSIFNGELTEGEGIDLEKIDIRLDNDKIPIINATIGTDSKVYIVFTPSEHLQCAPNGPLTYVANSYMKIAEFDHKLSSIYKSVFNSTFNHFEDAECVVNIEGIIVHVTRFDLSVKNIRSNNNKHERRVTIYIRSEV